MNSKKTQPGLNFLSYISSISSSSEHALGTFIFIIFLDDLTGIGNCSVVEANG